MPGFAVPFYLAHPRLLRLERKMTGEVEGSNRNWQMRILRHEAGHAIDSAYRLRRRARWRSLFGAASQRYAPEYRARLASRRHVQHLGEWYAQAHPTEDFAETFAVWLQPHSAWRRRYAGWPVLPKLEYVAAIAAEIGAHRPPVRRRVCIEALADNTRTLREHYRLKQQALRRRHRARADATLRRVFGPPAEPPASARSAAAAVRAVSAAALLRAHKPALRSALEREAGADRYAAQQLLRLAIERCERLQLAARAPRRALLLRVRAGLVSMARAYYASNQLRLHL